MNDRTQLSSPADRSGIATIHITRVAALVLICQKNFTTRTLRRLAVIGAFFFFHAGWMQYMRTHVYTQGGRPMLAALALPMTVENVKTKRLSVAPAAPGRGTKVFAMVTNEAKAIKWTTWSQ